MGDLGLIPGSGRSPGEGNDNSLQYSCLENSMGYNPWGRQESDMTERCHFHFVIYIYGIYLLSWPIFFWKIMHCDITQSCPTLFDPMGCSPPSPSAHGISQTGILEWVSISFSREPSQPMDQIQVSCTAGRFYIIWATREAQLHTQVKSWGWAWI